jgi:hypothetical protein
MTSFEQQLRAIEAKTLDKMERAARKITLDAFTEVILRSPVDKGRFRGNWQVAIGTVPDGTLELDDKTGSITISKAAAEAQGLELGDIVYMANNLPYAVPLEDGWSDQAPEGMVKLTVQRVQQIADAVIRQIGSE